MGKPVIIVAIDGDRQESLAIHGVEATDKHFMNLAALRTSAALRVSVPDRPAQIISQAPP